MDEIVFYDGKMSIYGTAEKRRGTTEWIRWLSRTSLACGIM